MVDAGAVPHTTAQYGWLRGSRFLREPHTALSIPLQHDVELGGVFVGERGPEVAADVREGDGHAAVQQRQGHHGGQQPTRGVILLPREK